LCNGYASVVASVAAAPESDPLWVSAGGVLAADASTNSDPKLAGLTTTLVGEVRRMALREPVPPKTRGGVRVYGCSPGCLLLSLAVSVVLTILVNVLIRLF
jgi:hypothetical protein